MKAATYKPGTQLTVGSHKVTIERWLSEGGFAHVYTARCVPPAPSGELVCLKRVAVPTKALLNLLRAEVEAMQRLRGAEKIVQYIDSHAERNKDPAVGGYEVFVLMEFCSGGGLIDFMNTRLRDQLREHEVLKIMYDITWGVAAMHSMQPALIHRDLKIENVLLTGDGDYKLCDFGSASPVLRAPKNPQELQILDDDIQHHTTAQYRSPEMLDLYRGFPIDEKSDIWALGVFLYKLCYYTTPFEQEGVPAILAASYIIPTKPPYSNRLKNMIRVLLLPNPQQRPTVYQVMSEICSMRGVPNPLEHAIGPRHSSEENIQHSQPLPVQNHSHAHPHLSDKSDYSKSSDSRESLRQSGEYSRSPESYSYRSPDFPARTPPPARTPEMIPQLEIPRRKSYDFDFTTPASPNMLSPAAMAHSPMSPNGDSFDTSFETKYPPLANLQDDAPAAPTRPKTPQTSSVLAGIGGTPGSTVPAHAQSLTPQQPTYTNATPMQHQPPSQPTYQRPKKPQLIKSPLPGASPAASASAPNQTLPPGVPAKPQLPRPAPVPATPAGPSASANPPIAGPTTVATAPAVTSPAATSASASAAAAGDDPLSRAKAIQERARAQIEVARAEAARLEAARLEAARSEAPERTKLKKILGGLEQRSSTVVLQNESHMDSSLDFLRALNTKERPDERVSSSGGHHHRHLKTGLGHGSWLQRSASRSRKKSHDTGIESDSDHDIPGRFDREQKAVTPDTLSTMSPDPYDSVNSSPTSSMRSFKPTNSIQQRVHSLVSGSHTQSSPRASKKGYGKYTDDDDDESVLSGQIVHSNSTPSLPDTGAQKPQIVKRPKPILHAATGPQKPPKPAKAEQAL